MARWKKKYVPTLLGAIALNIVLCAPVRALDEGGCLTCHQYPGLVRHEKEDGFKVLHIDETLYLQSPHGRLQCRQCHTGIEKVPHTGETEVACSTRCHLGEDAPVLPDDYPLQGFHRQEHAYITRLQDRSSCSVCHDIYPHSHDRVVRAFLNMHTGFMLCEVCHINRNNYPHLDYAWYQAEPAEFNGKPFGSYFHPQAGKTMDPTRFITRIAVFDASAKGRRLLHHTGDRQKAREFNQRAHTADRHAAAQQMAYFHRDIHKKSISLACEECHTTHGGVLDFRKLGFDPVKTNKITLLNLKGLVTKYRTFYLPKIFEPKP